MPVFEVDQVVKYHGMENHLQARIVCDGVAPTAWTVHTWSTGGRDPHETELRESGTAKDGRIELDNGTFKTELKASLPLITQWTVLDELRCNDPRTINRRVDLLQDLSLLKADHHLHYDGDVELPLADGVTELATVARIGTGVNPVHYLIDGAGRVQLVTNAILSWALESIDPA